jgi:hypothetical protein
VSIRSIVIDRVANVARVTITTATTPVVAETAVPAGRRYAPYNVALDVSGGAEPYQYTVSGLPTGVEATTSGNRVTIAGTPTVVGSFPVTVAVRDALGTSSQRALTLSVAAPIVFTSARLIAALGDDGALLTAEERAYLDEQGNRNGRIDVGDARAYLRRVGK